MSALASLEAKINFARFTAEIFAHDERVIKNLHRWTRLSSVKWEDAWVERLRFLSPEQVIFVNWPESRALKVEVYCEEKMAKQLVKRFGGKVAKVSLQVWSGEPQKPRSPLAIRGRLKVYADDEGWKGAVQAGKPAILIPAGMAFGTGEHATTATCLRFLSDLEPDLPKKYSFMDLGTGSGILAIAAKAFGAGGVKAIDFDPVAVRIAKENTKKNKAKDIVVEVGDALKLEDRAKYDVVAANLFSDVLIAAAPRIARSIRKGGWLIFSGVLRKQAEEVAAAFVANGLTEPRIVSRGKWCAGICQKTR